MSDVKETGERISTERLEEIARGVWRGGSYAALEEQQAMATELLATRHADAQEGGEVGEWAAPAAQWLEEAAKYFERRPTDGEDAAFWANYSNKQFCKGLADRLRALNPRKEAAAAVAVTPKAVAEAMREAWDEICFDTGCHPDDIVHGKGQYLEFNPGHWAAFTAKLLGAAPSNPVASDEMVAEFFKAISVSRTGDPHADVRIGLTAALSVSLQSGSDKP